MALQLSDISSKLITGTSYGGTRDYAVDMSDYLETGEDISAAYVVSAAPTVFVISSVAYSGQTVTFSCKVAGGAIKRTVEVDVSVVGDQGSADTWEGAQPIVQKLQS